MSSDTSTAVIDLWASGLSSTIIDLTGTGIGVVAIAEVRLLLWRQRCGVVFQDN